MTIDASIVIGRDALTALEPEWRALCDATDATVFQRPEWLLPFADLFEGTPVALAVRFGGRLVGLVPMSRHATPAGDELRLLGTGLSDFLDAIAAPAHRDDVRDVVATWTNEAVTNGCTVDWQQLPAGSLLLDVPSVAGASDRIDPHEPCPTLTLDPAARDPRRLLPPRMRDKLRYYTRRALAAGRIDVETATTDTCGPLLETVCRLHERRWEDTGGGVLRDRRVGAFTQRVALGLAARGLLALHVVRLNGAVIAGTFGFRDRTRVYLYLIGMDPARADLSPGTLCIGHVVTWAHQVGARSVEFLRGREAYKYFWGVVDRPTFRRQLLPARVSSAERS